MYTWEVAAKGHIFPSTSNRSRHLIMLLIERAWQRKPFVVAGVVVAGVIVAGVVVTVGV